MLVFGFNTKHYSEHYGNDDRGADDHYNCCAFVAARDRTATAVLVGSGLIRFSTGFIAIRFDIDRPMGHWSIMFAQSDFFPVVVFANLSYTIEKVDSPRLYTVYGEATSLRHNLYGLRQISQYSQARLCSSTFSTFSFSLTYEGTPKRPISRGNQPCIQHTHFCIEAETHMASTISCCLKPPDAAFLKTWISCLILPSSKHGCCKWSCECRSACSLQPRRSPAARATL